MFYMLSHHQIIYAFMSLTRFLSETLKPIVKTEFQLLYVYNLVGPFLQRFQQERTRCMLEVPTSSRPEIIIIIKVYLPNLYICLFACFRLVWPSTRCSRLWINTASISATWTRSVTSSITSNTCTPETVWRSRWAGCWKWKSVQSTFSQF